MSAIPPALPRPCRQDVAAAGAGRQVHGGAGHGEAQGGVARALDALPLGCCSLTTASPAAPGRHARPGSACARASAAAAEPRVTAAPVPHPRAARAPQVRILGRPAFHDIALASSGALSYLGPQWRRDIAFAGNNVPMQVRAGAGSVGDVWRRAWLPASLPQRRRRRASSAGERAGAAAGPAHACACAVARARRATLARGR